MRTSANSPAFPVDNMDGLTKREYFAAMALQGLIACNDGYLISQNPLPIFVNTAVHYADALIAALNTNKDGIDEDCEQAIADGGDS